MALGDNLATCALGHRILKGGISDPFKPKDIYDKHWRNLDKDQTLRAVEALESLNWISVEVTRPGPVGGRPSTLCHINPRVADELA